MAEHIGIPGSLLCVGLDRVFSTGFMHEVRFSGPNARHQVGAVMREKYFLAIPRIAGRPSSSTGIVCRVGELLQEGPVSWCCSGCFDFQATLDAKGWIRNDDLWYVSWVPFSFDPLPGDETQKLIMMERVATLVGLFQKFLDVERGQLSIENHRALVGLDATQYVLRCVPDAGAGPAELNRFLSCALYAVTDALWASPYIANASVAAGLENFIFNLCAAFLKRTSVVERIEVAGDLLRMVVDGRLSKILPPPKYVC